MWKYRLLRSKPWVTLLPLQTSSVTCCVFLVPGDRVLVGATVKHLITIIPVVKLESLGLKSCIQSWFELGGCLLQYKQQHPSSAPNFHSRQTDQLKEPLPASLIALASQWQYTEHTEQESGVTKIQYNILYCPCGEVCLRPKAAHINASTVISIHFT